MDPIFLEPILFNYKGNYDAESNQWVLTPKQLNLVFSLLTHNALETRIFVSIQAKEFMLGAITAQMMIHFSLKLFFNPKNKYINYTKKAQWLESQ